MDFYRIRTKQIEQGPRKGEMEVYADFIVGRTTDLMVRGRSFYAVWDENAGLWSTDEYDVQRLVDEDLHRFAKEQSSQTGMSYAVKELQSFSNNGWTQFRKYMQNISDNSHQLDQNLTFANSSVKKADYTSRRLPYALEAGDTSAWDELIGTLYNVEERAKLEWAIGAIVAGDAKKIQKFMVLYGSAGTGKSTALNIIQKLFAGYTTTFEAKALASKGGDFATESFKHNPLVAIQHDGDLSRIEDNTRLNSIISHEEMTMNEKYKPSYTAKVNAFLFMGTNQPVKISDAKSGIIRRLIDVHPTGITIPTNHYNTLIARIDFELGAIAQRCLEVYLDMGKNYYNGYRPLEMMLQTDVFFNFVEAHFDVFKQQNHITLRQAYALYKEYCGETGIERVLPQYKVREELRNYFDEFHERYEVDGEQARSVYTSFKAVRFKTESKKDKSFSLVIEETTSLLDELLAEQPAQYASSAGTPKQTWAKTTSVLGDLVTTELHYVKVPENHIVIDFDLKDANGNKSLERNLEAASVWPPTYAELSQGGAGLHLHYLYVGDASELGSVYAEGIEVKSLLGDASLRRRLSKCNAVPVATLTGGLPLKEKKMLDNKVMQSEKGMRELILRNLRKEIHPSTKSSVDFIKKILDDAYDSGMEYDVSDLRNTITAFANNSSNQALVSLKVVQQMQFKGRELSEVSTSHIVVTDDRLVFFDIEVYINLFIVCWKYAGESEVVRMINPSSQDIEKLFSLKLVGFNNRRYDNHILYGRFMGYSNEQLYLLSQKIVNNDRTAMFGEAYGISYTDIYDFSSKKQSLKKFQIELGIPHKELDLPWDDQVVADDIERVVDYCVNDVLSTEVTFEARRQDFIARQILADLSGLTVNDTTQKHTAKIIFGGDRNPQESFVYTDLSKEFPGYVYEAGKSHYRDELVGEGGYVYAEPGMYTDVVELDIASMHPTSIEQLNLFGEYTPRFTALKEARIAIKHRDYESARKMLGGKLSPYLSDPAQADALSYALKIVINIVYGLTSAKFENAFKHVKNVDNIVAKRGALFMIDLKHAVQEQGFQVVHIKTDSIKIPNATERIIEFVYEMGHKYGYDFEHEGTYEKFALVNDAVYIGQMNGKWKAIGAQFAHPYVHKLLFSGEEITFDDLCETKQVMQGAMYLDYEHDRPPGDDVEGMVFVGRIGRFVPVKEGQNGAVLWRIKDGKRYAVSGTKGFLWMEAELAQSTENLEIDMRYYDGLVKDAEKTISKFGDFKEFVK